MEGLMQDRPLVLPHLFDRAERLFPKKEVVTATATGRDRVTYGEWAARTRKLGGVLDTLGISASGRVATFAWNTARHLELWFAAPCSGRVLHTLNIRLFPEQLTYIVNHAEDEVIFVDKSLLGVLWPLVETFDTVKHIVVMDDGRGELPEAGTGPELLGVRGPARRAAQPVEWHVDDENRAASMCYTSGTTGQPQGRRVLASIDVAAHDVDTDGRRIGRRASTIGSCRWCRCSMPTHGGSRTRVWRAGASLVMPGPDLSAPAIAALIEEERVTVAAGVPTIWMGVLPELKGRDLSALRFGRVRRIGRAQGTVRGVP